MKNLFWAFLFIPFFVQAQSSDTSYFDFVNYANDGKDWFTITNPGKTIPNVENYAGGLFKGTRFVSVVATNGVELI